MKRFKAKNNYSNMSTHQYFALDGMSTDGLAKDVVHPLRKDAEAVGVAEVGPMMRYLLRFMPDVHKISMTLFCHFMLKVNAFSASETWQLVL